MNETINCRTEEFDKILNENSKITSNMSHTLIMTYDDSTENKNALINFDSVILSKDLASIVGAFRKNSIKDFPISNATSDLTNTLEAFEVLGSKVHGLTKANVGRKGETVPAIKLQVL